MSVLRDLLSTDCDTVVAVDAGAAVAARAGIVEVGIEVEAEVEVEGVGSGTILSSCCLTFHFAILPFDLREMIKSPFFSLTVVLKPEVQLDTRRTKVKAENLPPNAAVPPGPAGTIPAESPSVEARTFGA